MDDVITKPIDPDRLVSVLRRWAGGTPNAATMTA
jgi:hypothetical protein